MTAEFRTLCQGRPTFGEVLGDLLAAHEMRATHLARRIHCSDAMLSRLLADVVSDKMDIKEVLYIADGIGCSEFEISRLLRAFACCVLKKRGFL